MKTPVEVFLSVASIGGRLGIADDKLRRLLPADCPPDLKDTIRQHKVGLMEVLQLNFLVVRSDVLNEILIWTPDEETKESLVTLRAESDLDDEIRSRVEVRTEQNMEAATLTARIQLRDRTGIGLK